MPASTSCGLPAALTKLLPLISTSSCTEPPPRYANFERLNEHSLDHQHDGGEAQGIRQQQRDIEQLECDADLETDAVRPAEQLCDQHDLPHQRPPCPACRCDIG